MKKSFGISLGRSIGRGSSTEKMQSTGIVAQALRNVDILIRYPLTLHVQGYVITVPEPSAYILQKLLVNPQRTEEKQQKDIAAIEYLLRHLDKYGYSTERLREIFETLPPKQKNKVLYSARRLTGGLAEIFTEAMKQ